MGQKTTTSFIHLIVNGSKCSTLKERISSKKEMVSWLVVTVIIPQIRI